MPRFKNIAIRRKLTIIQVVTAFVAVLICCAFFVVSDIKILKESSVSSRNAIAEIIGVNVASALEFGDQDAASEMLLKLKNNPAILNAVVLDKAGKEFARYNKRGEASFVFPAPGGKEMKTQSGFGQKFLVSYRIMDKDFLGTVMLRSEINDFRDIILGYIKIGGLILLGSLLASFLISGFLQRIITNRLLSLVHKTKEVTETGNYSIRVAAEGNDEIAMLSGAFNNMLGQIEKTTKHLDEANTGLEKEVQQRTAQLANTNKELNSRIHQLKENEDRLRASEEKFRNLIQFSPVGITLSTADGNILEANPEILNMMGYETKEELMNVPVAEFYVDINDREKRIQLFKKDGYVKNFQSRLKRKDGSLIWVSGHVYPFKLSSGEIGMLSAQLDITQIKEIEEQLTESEEKFRNLVQYSPVGIVLTTIQGKILEANPAILDMMDFASKEELMNAPAKAYYVDENDREKMLNLFRKYGFVKNFEFRVKKKNAEPIWLSSNMTSFKTANNETLLLSASLDISQIKKAEQQILELNEGLEKRVEEKTTELIKAELRFKDILDNLKEGATIIGFDWQYKYANNTALKQTGYGREELLGYTIMEKYPGVEQTITFDDIKRCLNERVTIHNEIEIDFLNGNSGCYDVSYQPIPEGVFILSMDITERKKAEERLQLALESGQIGWWELDMTSDTSVRNLLHDQIFGYKEPITEWGAEKFFAHILPEDQPKAKLVFEEAMKNGKLDLETRIIWPDNSIHWIVARGTIIKGNNAQKMLGIVLDITKIKVAEEKLKTYAEELKTSNTELERFAYIASHDLQEPLRMVSSFLNLLTKKIEAHLDDSSRTYINFALDGAERMKSLIQDLLQYSRVGNNKEALLPTDLNEVMQYVKVLLNESIQKNGAQLTVQKLPVIKANKTLINQLFVNLVSNALKFQNGKTPEIEVGCKEEPKKWVFYVKDNGIGIDERFFDKIFIIFQRLHNKSEYSGTGIGLAICKKIIELHKGQIWIESQPGKGSIFYFSIPKT